MSEHIAAPVIILVGPTAIGKTALSLTIAEKFNCEIINVDSMQVYRYMDIGTAKPSLIERQQIRHHLIDEVDPDEHYDASNFSKDAHRIVKEIIGRGKIPLLTGGTGLYLKAFLYGLSDIPVIPAVLQNKLKQRLKESGRDALYNELKQVDPQTAQRIHPNDSQRLLRALGIFLSTGHPWSSYFENQKTNQGKEKKSLQFDNILQFALDSNRAQLYDRINRRTRLMIEQGFVEEVEKLVKMGYGPELKAMQSIGYRHILAYLTGDWQWDETLRLLARDTRRYAKRQFTWFKRQPDLEWFDSNKHFQIIDRINQCLL